MAIRRDKTTPFEVMGQVGRRGASEPSPPPAPSEPTGPAESRTPMRERLGSMVGGRASEGWAAASDWWARLGAGVPVVLRVPRGLAVLLVVALVGLLVLAYWVGHARGGAAAEARLGQIPANEAPMRPAPQAGGGAATAQPAAERPSAPKGDPREAGLNYFVLASYPPQAAQALADWLWEEHGVATVLESVQNGGLREVIAVNRGFHRSELSSEAYRAYDRELRAIGRGWERHSRGRDNLSSMYLKRYDGPDGSR